MPISILELMELLNSLKCKVISLTALKNIVDNVSNGGDISRYISLDNFNEIFNAISDGQTIKATAINEVVTILSAEVNEVVSDDFKAVILEYIYDGELITLTLTKFASDLFLDNKTVKAL